MIQINQSNPSYIGPHSKNKIQQLKARIPAERKGQFNFQPSKPIQSQIDSFFVFDTSIIAHVQTFTMGQKTCLQWFQGYFQKTQLRLLWPIRYLKFVDTQLDREHLIILRSWLWWIKPEKLILVFKQNEIDDLDIEEFILFIFERGIDLRRFFVISNPGIYKGQFLKQLPSYINKLNKENKFYEYRLIKNKIKKSIAIIRLENDWSDKEKEREVEQAREKIDQTCFYNLNLSRCFTNKNSKGFEHLIKITYDLDNLEQISGLDISENYLGTMSDLAISCKLLSTAKGLLELRLRKQKLIESSSNVQHLMGDRYDKLRVNIFDISGNLEIVQKTFRVLASEIFLHCKEIIFDEVLTKQEKTLQNIAVMSEAFSEQSKALKQKLQQQQYYDENKIKLSLRKLNLRTVENYTRQDLVEIFLKSTIFTEYSNVKKLTIQNLDVGRAQAYTKSIVDFKEYIAQEQLVNPALKNYKLPIKEITLPNQTYSMQIEPMKQFFKEYFFTKKGSILEIETFNMIGCFKQANREEGLKEICAQIYQDNQENKNPDDLYSIKHISFNETKLNMCIGMYKCLFLTEQFEIEGLTIISEDWDDEFGLYYSETINFLQQQENDFVHSLKILILNNVSSVEINLGQLLKLFVYNPQIRLKKLELQKVDLFLSKNSEEDLASLEAKSSNFSFSLEELILGSLEKQDIELCFFEHVIFTKCFKAQQLTLNEFKFLEENYQKIQTKLQVLKASNDNPFQNLTYLKLENIDFKSKWELIIELIFHEKSILKELHLKKITLDQNYKEALSRSCEKFLQGAIQNQDTQTKLSSLQILKLEECECKCELFMDIFPICILTELQFINCKELQQSLRQTFNENYYIFNRFSIEKFVLKDCQIQDLEIFEFLMCKIVFQDQQKLTHLNLSNCELSDDHLIILAKIIDKIKTESLIKRRYYNLRTIDLSGNSDISEDIWIVFFDKLMEYRRNEGELKDENKQQNEKEEIVKQNQEVTKKQITSQAKENCNIVATNDLNMRDKIISNYDLFKPRFATQLQTLTFQLQFANFSQVEKEKTYDKIISGLIINPESQVKQLTLSQVDLNLFMKNVHKAQAFTSLLIKNSYKNYEFKLKLSSLTFEVLEQNSDDVKAFVETFICTNYIDLKYLNLSNFDGIISQILLQIPKKKDQYHLEEIVFQNIKEQLTEETTQAFFTYFIQHQRFPLQSLTICEGIQFSIPNIIQKQQSNLQKFTATIINEPWSREINCQILGMLFASNALKKLDLSYKDKSFNEFFQRIMGNTNTGIEEIILQGTVVLSHEWLKFISRNSKTLKLLQIQELILEKPDILEEFLGSENLKSPIRLGSQINIKSLQGSGANLCIDKLIFNHDFGFEKINLSTSLNIKTLTSFQNLRIIKIDMNFNYDKESINESSLLIIAQHFIYNENSQCESLYLLKCNLKPVHARALTKPSLQFRKRIQKQNRKSEVQLKLKQFEISSSLNLGFDGHDTITKDLIFFEYISIEKIIINITNLGNEDCMSLVSAAKNWLAFQIKNKRHQNFQLQYLDISRNDLIQKDNVWHEFLTTFLFSDTTPFLHTCNFINMGINDIMASFIVKDAIQYLDSKPKEFKLPLKKINFSFNKPLTKYGWKNIFQNFLLHPKIDLIELNLIATMLDSREKLDAIYECFAERAKMTSKIPMQAFFCYNCTLKDRVFPFLTRMAQDYELPEDIIQSGYSNSCQFGVYEGLPEEYGDKVLLQNKLIATYNEFIETNKWKNYEDIKFSSFQLSFSWHYLKILNDYYKSKNERQITIFLNLDTLNQLSSIFKYCTERPGQPYPYKLVLQKETYDFLNSQESQIYRIIFIQIEFPNLELINQTHILEVWEQIKSWKSSIDQIQIEYDLTDDLCEEMLRRGYTERDILLLIRTIPPKTVRLEGGLSLQAVKGLYSILYDVHYFQYSIINYRFDSFLNTGIGYALRETAYKYEDKSSLTTLMKKIYYKTFSYFVQPTEKYMFNDETVKLNNFLSSKTTFFFLLTFNNVLFWCVTLLSPYLFTHYYNGDSSAEDQAKYCKFGTSKQASWVYYGFAFLSFLIEGYLYYWCQIQIPSHTKKIEIKIEEEEPQDTIKKKEKKSKKNTELQNKDIEKLLISTIQTDQIKPQPLGTFKKLQLKGKQIAESKYMEIFNHVIGVVLSQLFKFDLYNDVVFILTCHYCQEEVLFILTLIITCITQGIQILQFLYLLYLRATQTQTTAKILSTKFINDIYAIAFIGRHQALTKILDQVAPYNVSVFPNNWLTRKFLPKEAGRSMSNLVKAYFMQFWLEDLPQTILQAYFAVTRAIMVGGLSYQVYLIIITTARTVFNSFSLFMSIRPTTFSQDEFDLLSKKKKAEYNSVKIKQLEEEKKQLKIYEELFSQTQMVSPVNSVVNQEEQLQLL